MTNETSTETTIIPPPMSELETQRWASARRTFEKLGLDPAKVDAAMATNPAPPEPTNKQTPTPADKTAINSPRADLKQAERMAQALLKAGMDPAKIDAALEADGLKIADDRTPEQRAHDAAWQMDRKYDPADYKIPLHESVRARGSDAIAEINGNWAELLAAMQISPAIGAGFAERVIDIGQRYGRASEYEQRQFKYDEKQALLRSVRGDQAKADALIASAAKAIKTALAGSERAALAAATLVKSGAAHSAFVIRTLAAHADHVDRWATSRPKAG